MSTLDDFEKRRRAEAREAPYVQFPIGLLAFARSDWVSAAICYSIAHYARKKLQRDNPKMKQRTAVSKAQEFYNILESIPITVNTYKAVRKHLRVHGLDPDKTAQVRMPMSRMRLWNESAETDFDLSEKDLRVLAAIVSKQGIKKYVRMRFSEIGRRAAGAVNAKEVRMLNLTAEPLSRFSVRRSVMQLTDRGFVQWLTIGQKYHFFSYRTDVFLRDFEEEMRRIVARTQIRLKDSPHRIVLPL